ncbi:DUF5946 family protein [Nonomuraea sp. NPDC050310]|uniref:DUF5946 family protein n=1 Tax=Nonomuraea sp. NPDC050310 TaxID=3154935 RepID=UPI0033E35AD9
MGEGERAGCECGARGACVEYYHAILSEEHLDPVMSRWHGPVVCAYLLQHPDQGHPKYLDSQFRQLQFFLDQGLEALHRVAAHQVARNNHRVRAGWDEEPLKGYAALPEGRPAGFGAAFCELPVKDGSMVPDGHEAYGRRIEAIARATVEGWLAIAPR